MGGGIAVALIAMAVYDPPGDPRTELMRDCLTSIAETAKAPHRLVMVSNGITKENLDWIRGHRIQTHGVLIENEANIGTARAINKAWKLRKPGEHCLKIDSDVVLHEPGWLDKLEECIERDPRIGIIGLKRRDLDESPHQPPGSWAHSKLKMLPHVKGQPWLIVEKVNHVLGSCCLFNSALLDKIGYLVQMGQYGFDDALAAVRCEKAGFYSCFYPHYQIDHPDPGGDDYTKWKLDQAGKFMPRYSQIVNEYRTGKRNIYHGPDEDLA